MPIVTYLKAINDALREEMERDENVFILGEDVGVLGGAFKVTEGLFSKFGPERVVDTPISEELIVGAAVGAAVQGMRPVAEMQFMDFISCGFDQIVNMAATLRYRHGGEAKCPMVVRGPTGAYVHGGLFHSQSTESWFAHVPGLKVVYPATARDAKGLLKSAIRDDDPVIYYEHKFLYRRIKEDLPDEEILTPIGFARIAREGTDLTMISYGATVWMCLEAAEALAKEGVSAEVLDLRTLSPFDKPAIRASIGKTSKCLIVHEDHKTLGIGAEIAAFVAEELFDQLDGPILRVCSEDTHYAFSPNLEDFILPNTEKILTKARALLSY
jgi:2-oxoisovalerate dehydrogenase E1 component beta subunit